MTHGTRGIGLTDLLGKLGSSTRLAPGAESNKASTGMSFEKLVQSMLDSAKRGEVSTGRSVVPASGVDAVVSRDDSAAISLVTDQAEAAGATSLTVLLDDKALTIDVATRTITAAGPIERGVVRTDAEAFVDLRSSTGQDTPKAGVAADLLHKLAGPRRAD